MTETPSNLLTGGGDGEGGGRIEPIELQTSMQRSYIYYALAGIVGRALPDVRDGRKPVHRRVLYAMYDGGYRPDRGFSKCSRVVGDVMGQYHPHGDTAIYDTLVRLAQPWVMRAPLVHGQGNFGSPGDGSAAPRAVIEIDEDARGRTCLSITELPYLVNPDYLALMIAELADSGKVQGISDVRDDSSGRTGQRLVVVLKRDAVARVVLNDLLKHTELQTNFSANMLALVDGVPRTLPIDQFISNWVDHQIEVIQRRTRYC